MKNILISLALFLLLIMNGCGSGSLDNNSQYITPSNPNTEYQANEEIDYHADNNTSQSGIDPKEEHAILISTKQFINESKCDQIIDKEFFKICYDYTFKAARAVSYTLHGDQVNENNIDKRPSFKIERAVAREYRASTSDYVKSGYDRGHLACDAAFDWSEESLSTTYSLANIIPQARRINRYTWSKAERYARIVAISLGEVNIVNVVKYSSNPKRIGKNRMAVPDGYYKVLYNEDQNYTKCLYYKNDNNITTSSDKLRDHEVECSTVSMYW